MNALDWLLVVLVLAYAVSGYWQGFVTGALATAGLLLGGVFGVWLAPVALGDAAQLRTELARVGTVEVFGEAAARPPQPQPTPKPQQPTLQLKRP